MTYFKLNIPKTNEAIAGYKKNRKNYLEDINTAYKGLSYIESAWNDPNANGFIEKTKKDKYEINNYFNYIDGLYDEIQTFKENIDNVCHKYGYRKNSITLKFDDEDIQNCKKYLNNVVNLLNSSINQFDVSWFKSDFQYRWIVNNLKSEIQSVKYMVNTLLVDITNFSNSINREINNSKARMKKISDYNLKLKNANYKWKTININEREIYDDPISQDTYNSVSNIDIKVESNNSNLYENAKFYSTQATNINIEDEEKITGLNNNLNTLFNNQNEIKLEDSEQITGLNNDLNTVSANMNEIKLEESEQITGLNGNVNTSSTTSASINYDNEKEINGLNSNISSSDTNENNMIFEVDNNIRISDNNMVSENISNNNINYNVDSNVDVASNIKQAQANQTNVNMSGVVSNNYDLGSGINIGEVNPVNISTNINSNINLDTNIKTIDSISDLRDN